MTALRSRPATQADLDLFYPGLTVSVRAWVCEMDGEPAGILGLAIGRPNHSIFSVISDGLRPHLGSIVIGRMAQRLRMAVSRCSGPVLAIRDRDEPKSVHLLKRLGFRFHCLFNGDAVYIYEGAS